MTAQTEPTSQEQDPEPEGWQHRWRWRVRRLAGGEYERIAAYNLRDALTVGAIWQRIAGRGGVTMGGMSRTKGQSGERELAALVTPEGSKTMTATTQGRTAPAPHSQRQAFS